MSWGRHDKFESVNSEKNIKKTKTKNKTDVTYQTGVGLFQPISKHRDNGKLTKNMKSGWGFYSNFELCQGHPTRR